MQKAGKEVHLKPDEKIVLHFGVIAFTMCLCLGVANPYNGETRLCVTINWVDRSKDISVKLKVGKPSIIIQLLIYIYIY